MDPQHYNSVYIYKFLFNLGIFYAYDISEIISAVSLMQQKFDKKSSICINFA
jgi:hypothetical protein